MTCKPVVVTGAELWRSLGETENHLCKRFYSTRFWILSCNSSRLSDIQKIHGVQDWCFLKHNTTRFTKTVFYLQISALLSPGCTFSTEWYFFYFLTKQWLYIYIYIDTYIKKFIWWIYISFITTNHEGKLAIEVKLWNKISWFANSEKFAQWSSVIKWYVTSRNNMQLVRGVGSFGEKGKC